MKVRKHDVAAGAPEPVSAELDYGMKESSEFEVDDDRLLAEPRNDPEEPMIQDVDSTLRCQSSMAFWKYVATLSPCM